MTEPSDRCLDDDTMAELALGHLDGRARADALRHAVECRSCRRELQDLAEITGDVLQVGPAVDPPPDFEASVLARIAPDPRRRRRVIVALVGAAVAVIVALGISGLLERGDAIAEATMITPAGYDVGTAWYDVEDDGAWLFLAVPRWTAWEESGPHRYRLEAGADDDGIVDLGPVEFAAGDGSFATSIDPGLGRLRYVAVVDETGRVWCRGDF